MKSTTLAVVFTSTLLLLTTLANATPIPPLLHPMPSVIFDEHTSHVVLKLNDGRIARCTLPSQPSRAKADMVSSKLVASGKMNCKQVGEHRHGGKTLFCESGQQVSAKEASDTLVAACASHAGFHSME